MRAAPTSPTSARARRRRSTSLTGASSSDIATGAGSEALALTPDGHELWVAARADGTLAVVDTATACVKARLPLPGVPIRIAMTPDGRTALVTCAGSGRDRGCSTSQTRVRTPSRKVDVPLAPGAADRPFARTGAGQRAAGGAPGLARRSQRLRGGHDGRPRRPVRRRHARDPAQPRRRWRTGRPRQHARDCRRSVTPAWSDDA